MAETTKLTVSGRRVHGSGVASCGSYPDIKVSFTIEFSRETPNSELVTWKVTSASWSHPTSGVFGYKFKCYLNVGGTRKSFLVKANADPSQNWWNATTLYKPSGSFNYTGKAATVKIEVHGRDTCMSSGHYCYNVSDYYTVSTYNVTLPVYSPTCTVTYNNNGGTGTIPAQTKDYGETLTLTTDIPSYPIVITYHNDPDDEIYNTARPFLSWNTSADGSGDTYMPGDTYSADVSCTLYAQWGSATFTPNVPTKSVRISYRANGGSVIPPYNDINLQSLGYDTDPSASQPTYANGVASTTDTDLSLYPIYGPATMPFANLPIPEFSGNRFEGWYTDTELTQKVVTDITTMVDMILYAKWTYLPLRMFNGEKWDGIGPYIWKFLAADDPQNPGSEDAWVKVAPIYQFDYFNNAWINISAGSPPPYGIFNYPTGPWAVTGLRESFADGLEQNYQEYWAQFFISDSVIDKSDSNGRLTFGATCYRGAYHTLCMDAEVLQGTGGPYPTASIGIRYLWHGDKGTTRWDSDMDIRFSLVDYRTQTNYDHTQPWSLLSRQIVKFDLSQVTQDPFYLLLHACEQHYKIYSIWLE